VWHKWLLWAYSVEKLLAHKFKEIFTITTARTVSFFEVCCAKNNFGLPYVPKIFYFQDVGLEHGVFQHNWHIAAILALLKPDYSQTAIGFVEIKG
jgi:hypothetical protein